MARRALPLAAALSVVGVVVPMTWAGPVAAAAVAPARPYDLDGDGRQELVASASGLKVGDTGWSAGGVLVLPGSRSGLVAKPTVLTQRLPAFGDYPVEGGRFGEGLASADFDRDGFADLVVVTPSYIGYGTSIGVLSVIPGSAAGLDLDGFSTLGNPDGGQDDEQVGVGVTVVAADLDGDGYPDLAVDAFGDDEQVPGEPVGASGKVLVFSGGPHGLTQKSVKVLHHQSPGGGHQDWDSGFGSTLGAGDVDGDGIDDLVVGSSGRNDRYGVYPGSVSVCLGAPGGPAGCTRLAHSLDYVGAATIAVSSVTGGARPDLVVALPDVPDPYIAAPGAKGGPGSVRVLRLRQSGGPAVDRTLLLRQSSRGVPGGDEAGDAFGASLAVADLDRDGFSDLVIGSPGENDGRGRVTVVHGAATGWRTRGNSFVSQDRTGVPDRAEAGDAFGSAVTLLDHDGDGRLDLDVGAPGEDGSGSVTTLRGKGTGFTTKRATSLKLAPLGVADVADADFGVTLGG